MGGTPRWFLATLLLPEHDHSHPGAGHFYADSGGLSGPGGLPLVGGHTEITVAWSARSCRAHAGRSDRVSVSSPVRGAGRGCLLLTKGFPIEGVSIMAASRCPSWPPRPRRSDIARWQQFYMFRVSVCSKRRSAAASRRGCMPCTTPPRAAWLRLMGTGPGLRVGLHITG